MVNYCISLEYTLVNFFILYSKKKEEKERLHGVITLNLQLYHNSLPK